MIVSAEIQQERFMPDSDGGEEIEFTEIEGEDNVPADNEEAEDTVIGFSDEEEAVDETSLVKRLRDQNRELSRRLHQKAKANDADDPEPKVSDEPGALSDYDYDEDRFRDAWTKHKSELKAHVEWQAREASRKSQREQAQNEQTRRVEQQRRALGVRDYDDRAAIVKDRLSEAQLGILINAADDPARVIYALGRSETRLDMLASEENLAKFAATIGKLEKDIKVSKRKAPAPESMVRGATASSAVSGDDKYLAQLEKEAERTGDRSKIIAYNRQRRNAA